MQQRNTDCSRGTLTRRTALKAGAAGLVGLTAAQTALAAPKPKAEKQVLFIFLTGGLSHHDTLDMKPDAPSDVRGEFNPASTRTPGIQISEHLPLLAKQSETWSLVRSMATDSSGHGLACHMMLTGRRDLPPAFTQNKAPNETEWPSMPAVITYAMRDRNLDTPAAMILPEPSVNEAARVRPGQYTGRMHKRWDAWHVNIAAKCPLGNGACPDCFRFDDDTFDHAAETIFNTPQLTLPTGGSTRFRGRLDLLQEIQQQRTDLARSAKKLTSKLDQQRRQAISVLTNPNTSSAFEVENADPKLLERYGKNKFGLSCLMAKRLIAGGVKYVQVNLGKNSSWDTHRRNFVNLKRNLLPPLDLAVSSLLEDLKAEGMLENTLVVVTGEFGRTPKINKNAGRDHWGPCNTMLLAGGGVRGGNVIGKSDHIGAYPIEDKQTSENLSATIYQALGLPRGTTWTDADGLVHKIYKGDPIAGLMG